MRKKKESSILLPADKYWSNKLNIDFEIELARYRHLCNNLPHRKIYLLDGISFITRQDWKMYIEDKFAVLNNSELTEFYYYLQNQERSASVWHGISANLMVPYYISICAPFLINAIFDLLNDIRLHPLAYMVIIAAVLFLAAIFLLILYYILVEYKTSTMEKNFYSDLKEIAAEHMKGNG